MHKCKFVFHLQSSRWGGRDMENRFKTYKKGLKRLFFPTLVRYSNFQVFVPSGVWNRRTLLLAFCFIYLL